MTPVAEVLERAAKSDRRDCVIGGRTQPTPQTTADWATNRVTKSKPEIVWISNTVCSLSINKVFKMN